MRAPSVPRMQCGGKVANSGSLAACAHALAVIAAAVEIDLQQRVDRVLGAGANAGVAARADVEIDGIVLAPLHLERAEPARNAGQRAGIDGPEKASSQRLIIEQQQIDGETVSAGKDKRRGQKPSHAPHWQRLPIGTPHAGRPPTR